MCSRREFLVRTTWLALLSAAKRAFATQLAPSPPASEFAVRELEILAAAMDEIVPEGDGMPSATAAGGLQYLRNLSWQYPNIQQELSGFQKMLAHASAAQFGTDFPKLQPSQRLQVLQHLEKNQHKAFASFVSYVYEAYYTRPQVLGFISCSAPTASVDDLETLLAPVRKMERSYREAP